MAHTSLPLSLALIWLIAANLIAMLPSRDHHWRAAYLLIATGLPLLVWMLQSHGPFWAAAFVLACVSVLRWPLWVLGCWIRRRLSGMV